MAKITTTQIARFAADQIGSGESTDVVARKIAAFLIAERRTRESEAIFRAVARELAARGSTQVTVTSAHAVSDSIKQQLAELLAAKNPVFDEVIDEDVIGGVKARAGEAEVDFTVRARLNKFKQHVINS